MCAFCQSWSLVEWQWIWYQVCRHTSSSCVCVMPTTLMMTRKSDLYSPPSSTASRRSSRSQYTLTNHSHLKCYNVTQLCFYNSLKRAKCFPFSLLFCFSTEKRWWLWDCFLLVVQYMSFPALPETVQWWRGEISHLRHTCPVFLILPMYVPCKGSRS